MGGLGRLFSRIIPIITLVCFVCLGITHAFNQISTENHTYLTTETINIGTQEQPNNIEYYNFDIASYLSNINVNILKEATEKTIDLDKLSTNVATFSEIWEDGYNFGDISKTILNAILLSINVAITIVNMILIIPRIIAGIILTGMSLIGININTTGIITTTLKTLLKYLAIPLIAPTDEHGSVIYNNLAGTTWYFNEDMNVNTALSYSMTFTSNGQTFGTLNYILSNNGLVTDSYITYNYTYIYSQRFGKWSMNNLNNAYRTITIVDTFNNDNNAKIYTWLLGVATQVNNNRKEQEDTQKTTENEEKKTNSTEEQPVLPEKKYIFA